MPKPLAPPGPHHMLTRLLNPEAVAGVREPVALATEARAVTAPSPREERNASRHIKRECTLSPATDEALSRLTEMVRRCTGARINTSCAMRSLLLSLHAAWPRLEDELRAIGPMSLPGNGAGRAGEREAMEQRIARAIHQAVRASDAPR